MTPPELYVNYLDFGFDPFPHPLDKINTFIQASCLSPFLYFLYIYSRLRWWAGWVGSTTWGSVLPELSGTRLESVVTTSVSMMTTTGTGPSSTCPSTAHRRNWRWWWSRELEYFILVNGKNVLELPTKQLCIKVVFTIRRLTVFLTWWWRKSRKLWKMWNSISIPWGKR